MQIEAIHHVTSTTWQNIGTKNGKLVTRGARPIDSRSAAKAAALCVQPDSVLSKTVRRARGEAAGHPVARGFFDQDSRRHQKDAHR